MNSSIANQKYNIFWSLKYKAKNPSVPINIEIRFVAERTEFL